MDGRALPSMRRATVLLTVALFLATALAGCLETFSSDAPPTVTMSVSPSGTVKVGDNVHFEIRYARFARLGNSRIIFEDKFLEDNYPRIAPKT